MTTTNNVRVLGRYEPAEYWYERIQAEFRDKLPDCCRRERISVRVPPVNERDLHPDNLMWHQDGGGPEGTTKHMILWADREPTFLAIANDPKLVSRIRKGNDKLGIHESVEAYIDSCDIQPVRPEPFQIIWLDNCTVFHRMPLNTSLDRWFISVRCSGE